MKSFLGKLYRTTDIGYYLIRPFFVVYEQVLKLMPDKTFVKLKFKRHMGYTLDLENPKTFNEKINWLKIYDRSPLHTQAADKYRVREYIEKKIGGNYLIPLLYHTKNPKDLAPENLPDSPFIIKANHNSSGGAIVKDKKHIDWKKVQKQFKKLLGENYFYSSREWQYKNIEPRIVVEKLLTDSKGNIPYDYKMHCFNGKLVFTQVDLDRQTNHTRNLYDADWQFIPCEWKYQNGRQIEKPLMYKKMRALAETIAQDFIYVRVDFYTLENLIFFGELTFHSESGCGEFVPHSYDISFGEQLNLQNNGF